MFSGRPSVPLSVRPCVRDSRGSFMFPRYLQYLLMDFRQPSVTGASRDRDELIRFWGQKVKVQGHAIAAEALPSSATFASVVCCHLVVFHVVDMCCCGDVGTSKRRQLAVVVRQLLRWSRS